MTAAVRTKVKYPHVEVDLGDLQGPDGNAFAIIGNVSRALRSAGVGREELKAYAEECRKGSYADLLNVTGHWVTVL